MTKAQLRKKCDKAWFTKLLKPQCDVCGKEARQVHHFFPKGQFGHLRYCPENAISICFSCHFAHHHKGDPRIHQTIVDKRGLKWYWDLRDKSRENPQSYQTISYYKSILESL